MPEERPELVDVNAIAGGLLRDLATIQTSKPKAFGYKRAAAAVLELDRPLSDFAWHEDALVTIHGIGPASARVLREVLETGGSPTVERAIDAAGQRSLIDERRALRRHFLSRSAVLAVLGNTRDSRAISSHYRGDFHLHSEWSDGVPTLEDLVGACLARGYSYAAITDHSYGLRIAHGMSMTDIEEQQGHVDRLNRGYRGAFRLLKGVEANIGATGELDLSDDEARRFELVLASPHSKLRSNEDQTDRFLRVLANPSVRILGHPRGRIRETRRGVLADWDRVFVEAAAAGVAIELDGDPARQDLDYALARRAKMAGCLFALDSDAHATTQLHYADTAIAHATLAGIDAAQIVNCWDVARLLAWVNDRASATASPAAQAHSV